MFVEILIIVFLLCISNLILLCICSLLLKAINYYKCYLSVKDPTFIIRANKLYKEKYEAPKIRPIINFKKKEG